jgi:leucyl aminopeptidase
MSVHVLNQAPQHECLVVFFDDSQKPLSLWNDAALRDYLKLALESDFQGKNKESLMTYLPGHPLTKRLLLVGLGKRADVNLHRLRSGAAVAVAELQKRKIESKIGFVVPTIAKLQTNQVTEALMLGSELFQYRPDEMKTAEAVKKRKWLSWSFLVLDKKELKAAEKGCERGKIIASGVNFSRRLINTSPLQLYPESLAEEAKKMAMSSPQKSKIKLEIWDEAKLSKNAFGGVLAVGRGSANRPHFIILEYHGAKKSEKPIVLVGKGVTFDSGGLSLKPPPSQETMKYDMAGAASVLGAFKIATDLGLKKNLVVLVPTVENMPSGHAQRPGDVITMASGKTVEVLNTDAEGRLILADALFWATTKYQPKACIDVATLTGACALAVGNAAAGVYSNHEKTKAALIKCGEEVNEGIWPLPNYEDFYADLLNSEVADLRNIGKVREAGASTASIFLKHFVHNDVPWCHLDIAGCGWYDSPRDFIGARGASGVPIRTLAEFVESF